MARKGKKKKKEEFERAIPDEGRTHKPKKERFHIAQEIRDLHGPNAEDAYTRRLMPWARDCATGLPKGTTQHQGWFHGSRFVRA